MRNYILGFMCFIILIGCTIQGCAQDKTNIVVRARAKDAKFIGDGMGGAMITIVNTKTGDTLARGLTKGGTGDTKRLIKEPISRYEKISTPETAKFETSLTLQRPTLVTIKATANYKKEYARITTSTQKWLIPGKDIVGDGIILEIPGFVINNKLPETNKTYATGKKISIRSHIVMMCGCSTSAGGLWNSSQYEIKAQVEKNGKTVATIPLSFAGEPSFFEGAFTLSEPGPYYITVYAFDSKTGNTGVDKTGIMVE